MILCDDKEEAIDITTRESSNVIDFFKNNNLVNNPEKAAVLYNSNRKGKTITIENIGGEVIKSTYSEKLLGLHINSNFSWETHVEKLMIELKKRIGILKRIKNRVPKNKLVIIAEAIFNSKIRYGIAVYLNPVYHEEELKVKKLSKNATELQTLQNIMLRLIFDINIMKHTNMTKLRQKIKMMSVNQLCVYHTLLEAHNVIKNSSAEDIKSKWENKKEKRCLRSDTKKDQKIPVKPSIKCRGFSYNASLLYNKLPCSIKNSKTPKTFKSEIKTWIWKNIPGY